MMRIGTVEITGSALLAPMAGVTDLPFRRICSQMGAALTYTEMVSAKGLLYSPDRSSALLADDGMSGPKAMQLFGNEPEIMADMAEKYGAGYDIVDINMGCPVTKIVKAGQGSALMNQPDWAGRIVSTLAKRLGKPITVKIRKGWNENRITAVEFALLMESCGAAAVTVHGRTREQFYTGKADWEIIRQVKEKLAIPVIGNGDIFEAGDAVQLLLQTGCDAVMVGRGAQGNPWIFQQINALLLGQAVTQPSLQERLAIASLHGRELCDLKGERTGVQEMRKQLSWYIKGIPQAARWRQRLNALNTVGQLTLLVEQILLESK